MKVLLFGGTGGLGRAIEKLCRLRLDDWAAPRREQIDLCHYGPNLFWVQNWIRLRGEEAVVINAAAISNIDECQQDPVKSYLINTLIPGHLVNLCAMYGARFVQFSTDQVFNTVSGGQFAHRETDDPFHPPFVPASTYAHHKAIAEKMVLAYDRATVIRVQWLYGSKPSWIDTVLTKAQAGEPITTLTDYLGLPTHVQDVAQALWQLLQSPAMEPIYHLVAEGEPVSRHELAQFILQHSQTTGQLQPQTLSEMTWSVPRVTSWIKNYRGPKLRAWPEALQAYLHNQSAVNA